MSKIPEDHLIHFCERFWPPMETDISQWWMHWVDIVNFFLTSCARICFFTKYFTIFRVFTLVLTDGFPLEFDRQLVPLNHHFLVCDPITISITITFWWVLQLQLLWPSLFGECSNYNFYHHHFFVSAPITIAINIILVSALIKIAYTILSCSFVFSVLLRGLRTYLSSLFFQAYSVVNRYGKVHYSACSLSLMTILRSGHLANNRWYVYTSKFQIILHVSSFKTASRLSIYHFFFWSNLIFLHNPQRIIYCTKLCLVLYEICANVLLFRMWLIVSSHLLHNSHLLFCCI